jgi:predicted transcriptional regulator
MNIINFLIPKSKVAYLEDTSTIRQGLEKMHSQGYTAIPVITKDGIYIGTVTEGDFLWSIVDNEDFSADSQEEKTIIDILRCDWNAPVHITDTIDKLLELVTVQNFVPVVDDREVFIGIITRKDIIKYFRKTYLEGQLCTK